MEDSVTMSRSWCGGGREDQLQIRSTMRNCGGDTMLATTSRVGLYNVGEVDISLRQASCHLKAAVTFPHFSKCTDDRVVTLHTKKRASFYGWTGISVYWWCIYWRVGAVSRREGQQHSVGGNLSHQLQNRHYVEGRRGTEGFWWVRLKSWNKMYHHPSQ